MVHNDVVWGIVHDNWRFATASPNSAVGYLLRLKETWLRILNQRQTAAGAPNEDFAAARSITPMPAFSPQLPGILLA